MAIRAKLLHACLPSCPSVFNAHSPDKTNYRKTTGDKNYGKPPQLSYEFSPSFLSNVPFLCPLGKPLSGIVKEMYKKTGLFNVVNFWGLFVKKNRKEDHQMSISTTFCVFLSAILTKNILYNWKPKFSIFKIEIFLQKETKQQFCHFAPFWHRFQNFSAPGTKTF